MRILFTFAFLFLCIAGYAQQLNPQWKEKLERDLTEFQACDQQLVNGINTCNPFIGKSLTTVYKVNDFYSAELGRFMLVSEIVDYLKDNKQWKLLGHGYEQEVLKEAQSFANSNKAVVAVYLNEENIGLLSLILPGEMKTSGTWSCKVPNSAAFIIGSPEKSYIEKGLSYSFDRKILKSVLLYGRSY